MPHLHLSWQAYQTILLVWIAVALIVFFVLLKIAAPYGRHASAKWGPQIPNRLGWIIMELTVLCILWIFLWPYRVSISTVSWVMIGLFNFHYINRSLIYPFRIHTKGKKMPLLITGSAIIFNIVNGFSLGYFFTRFAFYADQWLTDPRFLAGTIIFFAGLYINWKADNVLIHLRHPGETGYKIPRGWLFNKISCPNLFGELMEWAGFAILGWNLPFLCFFIWTAANLIPRAIAHNRWYREHFPDYPSYKKAIIPYIL
jgi:3-oxo-5-alpha-steroid 4-dehydrogenase 1